MLLLKVDKTELIDAYNKSEVDALLDNKLNVIDQIDAYTKGEADTLLLLNVNQSTTYTKIETDYLISQIQVGDVDLGGNITIGTAQTINANKTFNISCKFVCSIDGIATITGTSFVKSVANDIVVLLGASGTKPISEFAGTQTDMDMALLQNEQLESALVSMIDQRTGRQPYREILKQFPQNLDDQILCTVDAIKLFAPNFFSLRKVADIFEIPHTTLKYRIDNRDSRKKSEPNKRLFDDTEEEIFVAIIISTYEEGSPFTQASFYEYLQQEYPEKEASKGYVQKLTNVAASRIACVDFVEGRPACLIHNCDESGLQDFVDAHNKSVLAPVGIKPADCRYKVERDGRKVSELGTIVLDKERVPILCVVKRMTIDNNLYDNGLREGRDVIVLTSQKGNVNSYHFFIQARDIYIPFVKKQRRDNNLRATERATLIIDGYGAHVMDEVSNLFKKNCIDVLLLPAYSSHRFQPLNLTVFHSMKACVKSRVTVFEKNIQAHK
ncbi:MAG: hypothetical protein EZS28_040558, partial [Streblomastix strix]